MKERSGLEKMQEIIIEGDNLTSDEKDDLFVKRVEKNLGTGPIIGEAYEILRQLSRNLMIRDLLLDAMGVSIENRKAMFKKVNSMLKEKDREILAKREEQQCTQ